MPRDGLGKVEFKACLQQAIGFGHHVSKGRVNGCLIGSFPARGNDDGECTGTHLVCCITLVFTILGHQGLAWNIVGGFQSAFRPSPVILHIAPEEQMICQKCIPGRSEWGHVLGVHQFEILLCIGEPEGKALSA